jgi:predicted N-formylglutamate amidohydrolase
MGLLTEDDVKPFRLFNAAGRSRFLLTADHAGNLVPRALGDLGLAEADLRRHIGWDIGISGVTIGLAERLDAVAILQNYSRLVVDCNRQPYVPSAFPVVSEATAIPGNAGLTEAAKRSRQAEIFDPYHDEIKRLIAARGAEPPVYVAMHSFTPVYLGERRAMDVAVLYNRSPRLSQALAQLLRAEGDLTVAENDPYRVSDESDYGVPVHAERGGLDYLEIEIRQDLIESEAGQASWADRLARLLPLALAAVERPGA